MPFTYRCQTCGRVFTRAQRSDAKRLYCSRACHHEGLKIRGQRPCETCGTLIELRFDTRRRRFCSLACRSLANRIPLADKFWNKVDKGSGAACWLWTGYVGRGRYGVVNVTGGRGGQWAQANRVAWMLTYGPIPPGLNVLHRCDVPRCVRPDHLFLGTQADNMADMRAKGRARYRAKHR